MSPRDLFASYRRRPTREALLALLRGCQGPAFSLCYHVLRHCQDAEDAAQEVLLELLDGLPAIRDEDGFDRWLYRAALNTALDARKKARRRVERERRVSEMAPSVPQGEMIRESVQEALGALDDDIKSVMIQHLLERRTLEDLSRERGCSVSTIWNRIEQGKEQLRLALAAMGIMVSIPSLAIALEPMAGAPVPPALSTAVISKAAGMATAVKGGTFVRLATPWAIVALVATVAVVIGAGAYVRWNRDSFPGQVRQMPRSQAFVPAAPHEREVLVEVRSGRDGKPIQGARVGYALESKIVEQQMMIPFTADAQGRVRIDGGGKGWFSATAPGHVGVQGTVQFKPGIYVIVLTPSGAVEFDVRNELGQAVGGVEVQIILPIPNFDDLPEGHLYDQIAMLWEEFVPKRRSGADGKITWPELAPGKPYRWQVTSKDLVDAADDDVGVLPGGQVVTGRVRDRDTLLGPTFEVESGGTTRVPVKLLIGASLSGLLPLGTERADVELSDRRDYEVGGPKPFTSYNTEASLSVGNPGDFRFGPIRAGRKRLRAWWKSEGNRYRFVNREFDLIPGEHRELGILDPTSGHSVEAVLRIEGEENLPEGVRKGGVRVSVHFSNRREPHVDGQMIFAELFMTAGEPVHLDGLMDGVLLVAPWWKHAVPGVKPEYAYSTNYPIPSTSRVDVVIKLAAKLPVRVTAAYPPDKPACPLRVCLLPVGEGQRRVIDNVIDVKATEAREVQAEDQAVAGEYEVWVFSDALGSDPQTNYFGKASIRVGPAQTNEVRVQLEPGATIQGKAVTRKGKPGWDALGFLPNGYMGKGIYRCKVAPDGRYVLPGVAPGVLIWPISSEIRIQAGLAGSVVEAPEIYNEEKLNEAKPAPRVPAPPTRR